MEKCNICNKLKSKLEKSADVVKEWNLNIDDILTSPRKVHGKFHTPKVDKDNEFIEPDAVEGAVPDFMHLPILHDFHKERTIGIVTKVQRLNDGSFDFDGIIKNTPDVDDVWAKIETGNYNQVSLYGSRTKGTPECSFPPGMRGGVCKTTGIRLDSISACDTNARNDGTSLQVAKAIGTYENFAEIVKALSSGSSMEHSVTDYPKKKDYSEYKPIDPYERKQRSRPEEIIIPQYERPELGKSQTLREWANARQKGTRDGFTQECVAPMVGKARPSHYINLVNRAVGAYKKQAEKIEKKKETKKAFPVDMRLSQESSWMNSNTIFNEEEHGKPHHPTPKNPDRFISNEELSGKQSNIPGQIRSGVPGLEKVNMNNLTGTIDRIEKAIEKYQLSRPPQQKPVNRTETRQAEPNYKPEKKAGWSGENWGKADPQSHPMEGEELERHQNTEARNPGYNQDPNEVKAKDATWHSGLREGLQHTQSRPSVSARPRTAQERGSTQYEIRQNKNMAKGEGEYVLHDSGRIRGVRQRDGSIDPDLPDEPYAADKHYRRGEFEKGAENEMNESEDIEARIDRLTEMVERMVGMDENEHKALPKDEAFTQRERRPDNDREEAHERHDEHIEGRDGYHGHEPQSETWTEKDRRPDNDREESAERRDERIEQRDHIPKMPSGESWSEAEHKPDVDNNPDGKSPMFKKSKMTTDPNGGQTALGKPFNKTTALEAKAAEHSKTGIDHLHITEHGNNFPSNEEMSDEPEGHHDGTPEVELPNNDRVNPYRAMHETKAESLEEEAQPAVDKERMGSEMISSVDDEQSDGEMPEIERKLHKLCSAVERLVGSDAELHDSMHKGTRPRITEEPTQGENQSTNSAATFGNKDWEWQGHGIQHQERQGTPGNSMRSASYGSGGIRKALRTEEMDDKQVNELVKARVEAQIGDLIKAQTAAMDSITKSLTEIDARLKSVEEAPISKAAPILIGSELQNQLLNGQEAITSNATAVASMGKVKH